MTVASEITRLCNAKSAMKTEIIAKWVSVADSVKLDQYACCIKAIPTWSNTKNIDLLVVWGWWWTRWMGGWWAWWFIENMNYELNSNSYSIVVWKWGTNHTQWWTSCFWTSVIAYWWWWGWSWYTNECPGGSGGSWWGWWLCWCSWWSACSWQWYSWWKACECAWWGWWGAWGYWCPWKYAWWYYFWWDWWIGRSSCISWSLKWYSWGWGWGSRCWQTYKWASWLDRVYQCASYCGGWASWDCSGSYIWRCWVVILRYKTDGSCWINCATGGCKYTCWNYTIHCFTCDWTFSIVC